MPDPIDISEVVSMFGNRDLEILMLRSQVVELRSQIAELLQQQSADEDQAETASV
ncbi:hypothetical protein LCGC14_1547470 [marine sediment metagenome]|uniref:Uncharacterized protein n=1 Tax=marine sediment metagenome TaxID=412755 RepID=A0A0F9LS63_9ZZZZ